ncbi:DUF6766 family protein [Pseudoxanthomonas sp.]|jgi:hypothetical protein|uniref:DUF6766 family protein n=1 Tax=Pseudoxanthomonas sp. TaxID=1871049 RepID=UPI002FE18846
MTSHRSSFWYRNGLSLVLLGMFLVFFAAQTCTGWRADNQERAQQGQAAQPLTTYLQGGHFLSATFENWESEFLQMGMYVLLTVWLRQRGSAESRELDPAQEQERVDPGPTPTPVTKGGVWKWLYAHSLSVAFGVLFLCAFVGHAYGSWLHENEQRIAQGLAAIPLSTHLGGAQFWFESMQNWQSEFLAVLSIVVLSIFLRQDKSPESKALAAPHGQTGT